MTISPEAKQKVQLFLVAAILITAVRSGYILYQRHAEKVDETRKQAAPPLNPDYYVTPKKLHPYDLKSARQLTEQPVWVKEGYRYTYYPYDRTRRHSEFGHEAGTLLPLQRLQIKDVVADLSPSIPDQRQVMAVFEQEGKSYAFPIGAVVQGSDYHIFSDDMLFIQDPHDLYKHWPADVWASIDKHEVKPGMNELQTDFAIGMGTPERQNDSAVKTVHYPNGGNPLTVTYRDGKATEIKPGAA